MCLGHVNLGCIPNKDTEMKGQEQEQEQEQGRSEEQEQGNSEEQEQEQSEEEDSVRALVLPSLPPNRFQEQDFRSSYFRLRHFPLWGLGDLRQLLPELV